MPVKDRQDIVQQATIPDNLDQGPKFGAITELVKDVFVLELRHFFTTAYTQTRAGEFPRIDKYSVTSDINTDPLSTAVNLIRSYPDIEENLPLIAIMATTGRNVKMSISNNYTSMVVPTAKVISSATGPFTLTNDMTITLTSQPTGLASSLTTSSFRLPSYLFQNISVATLDEVISAINFQALYVHAYKEKVAGVDMLAIRAGGSHGTQFPNKITMTGGTALTALGFTVSQTDQNYGTGKKAMYRHHICADITVSIEVVAESENVRTEITDLLYDFWAYALADRKYTLYGRSTFDPDVDGETYQIIVRDNEISLSGEQEAPRQGDEKDKLYINRLSIPVTAFQFSDRVATDADGTDTTPLIQITVEPRDDLPEPN